VSNAAEISVKAAKLSQSGL